MAGKTRRLLAINIVGRADFQFRKPAEDIEQHDGERIDSAQPASVAQRDDIEPAATARTPRDGAILVSAISKVLADFVVLFGGKRSAAHARRIGLHDADAMLDMLCRNARSTSDADA
jgi:hypothetical protein